MKQNLLVLLAVILVPAAGCKKKSDPEPVKHVTFTVNNVTKTFNTSTSFNRLCFFSTYCNAFNLDESVTDKNMFYIGLPANVQNGLIYTQVDNGFSVFYMDETGKKYETVTNSPFTLTVTKWEGNGNWTSGTFHGILYIADNPGVKDSVIISNGSYESKIWYITN